MIASVGLPKSSMYMLIMYLHRCLMYYACYPMVKWEPRDGHIKHLEAGQSYAAISTRSGAIFGGNRARSWSSCAAVSKGRQNEWRKATGTHATRLQLLDGQPM